MQEPKNKVTNAKEARELAMKRADDGLYIEVIKYINKCAENGDFSANYYVTESNLSRTVEKLKAAGFGVSWEPTSPVVNEHRLYITW